jgi:hypothetical protein
MEPNYGVLRGKGARLIIISYTKYLDIEIVIFLIE